MRLIYTDEMNELRKIFEPFEVNGKLVENAPKEVLEAEKKFMKLFKSEMERASDINLL